MSAQNSQDKMQHGSGCGEEQTETNTKEPGGFMAIYHDIEEICYGPELGLSAKERVFLCLRHKLLRDGLCQKLIGRKFIQDKTGLSIGQIETAVKSLEAKDIILVHRTKIGNQCMPNQYELNPKKFGNLYNWYKNNPTVRVYEGSKGRSFSNKGLPPVSEGGVPPNSGGVLPPVSEGGVPPNSGGVRDLNLAELFAKARCKNPFQEPISKEPDLKEKSEESFTRLGKWAKGSKAKPKAAPLVFKDAAEERAWHNRETEKQKLALANHTRVGCS